MVHYGDNVPNWLKVRLRNSCKMDGENQGPKAAIGNDIQAFGQRHLQVADLLLKQPTSLPVK